MGDQGELEDKMRLVMKELKETFDLSLEIGKKHPDAKKRIEKYWEDFLTHFLEHIKKREKETGEDLLKGLSFTKLLKYLR